MNANQLKLRIFTALEAQYRRGLQQGLPNPKFDEECRKYRFYDSYCRFNHPLFLRNKRNSLNAIKLLLEKNELNLGCLNYIAVPLRNPNRTNHQFDFEDLDIPVEVSLQLLRLGELWYLQGWTDSFESLPDNRASNWLQDYIKGQIQGEQSFDLSYRLLWDNYGFLVVGDENSLRDKTLSAFEGIPKQLIQD